jgi:3-phosphoshikimate 1-carboxyvinyltransferase
MSTNSIRFLQNVESVKPVTISLAASKSISNRVLIIDSLCPGRSDLQNLAEARDTRLMLRLLSEKSTVIDVKDAGTTMRFLTGYFAITNQNKVLQGTSRMHQRPIGVLVDALREIGADIKYLSRDGYPPLETKGFQRQKSRSVKIRGDISSQYISSLMMIAPTLPYGLSIELTGKVMSRPYIEMTLGLMKRFGADHSWNDNVITIPHQQYRAISFKVEADWSAASYWYSLVALSKETRITLLGLDKQSFQGDRQIAEIMEPLGVNTDFHDNQLTLSKGKLQTDTLTWDFSSCPDLGQTVMTTCAALGVTLEATGLESLRIKETDRITAMKNELGKLGAKLDEQPGLWKLYPATKMDPSSPVTFETYEDHRMAMALAPLALRMPVTITEPDVVQKSYPGFWKDLAQAGLVGMID